MGRSSFWHTTCTALMQGAEPDWAEVCDYRQPLVLFMASRYPAMSASDREDVIQEILIDIKAHLFTRYNAEKGRFRAYLTGVIRNKVVSQWRRNQRYVPLEGRPEPVELSEDDGLAVDVVADLLGALRRWHDKYGTGFPQDLTKVYVLAGRLVRGETYAEIAQREGLSIHAVKRILLAARDEILADLLTHTLPLDEPLKESLDFVKLAGIARAGLAEPRRRHLALESVAHEPVRRALDSWLDGYEVALRHLPGGNTREGQELKNGLSIIFGGEDEGED